MRFLFLVRWFESCVENAFLSYSRFFLLLFIFRCLSEDPTSRIGAHDALNHSFFKDHDLMPTTKDMVLLPSHILQLYNVFKDEQYKDPKEVEGNHFYILALFFKITRTQGVYREETCM